MNTPLVKRSNARQGSALLSVMGTVFGVALVAAALGSLARNQVHQARLSRDFVRAQIIAESGANHAYSVLKTNFAARTSDANFPPTAFDSGTFDATVVAVGTNQATITSIGTFGSAIARSKVDVMNIPKVTTNSPYPPVTPFACSLFVNGYMRFNGSSSLAGAVHVNNYILCNGTLTWASPTNSAYVESSGAAGYEGNGGGTIYGTVRAPRISFAGAITDRRVEAVPVLPMPTLDLTAYYNTAVANGQVFGSTTISANQNWGTIPGGVRWYNGTLTIKNNGSIKYTGCVIATGNITVKGGCTTARYGALPSLISRDGTITFDGTQTTYGLIYSKGDLTFNGSGYHNGTIIVGGNLTFNGSADVDLGYLYCNPSPSPSQQQVSDYVIVTAWQE